MKQKIILKYYLLLMSSPIKYALLKVSADLYFEEAEEETEVEKEIYDTSDDVEDIEETTYNHYDRISNGNFAGHMPYFHLVKEVR